MSASWFRSVGMQFIQDSCSRCHDRPQEEQVANTALEPKATLTNKGARVRTSFRTASCTDRDAHHGRGSLNKSSTQGIDSQALYRNRSDASSTGCVDAGLRRRDRGPSLVYAEPDRCSFSRVCPDRCSLVYAEPEVRVMRTEWESSEREAL
jgi:hypothetical protein